MKHKNLMMRQKELNKLKYVHNVISKEEERKQFNYKKIEKKCQTLQTVKIIILKHIQIKYMFLKFCFGHKKSI